MANASSSWGLSPQQKREICAKAPCDPRSLQRVFTGEAGTSVTNRVVKAVCELGLMHKLPSHVTQDDSIPKYMPDYRMLIGDRKCDEVLERELYLEGFPTPESIERVERHFLEMNGAEGLEQARVMRRRNRERGEEFIRDQIRRQSPFARRSEVVEARGEGK